MAENGRPTVAKKAKVKKPLGPITMYVLYKGQLDSIDLKRNKRDVLAAFLQDRDLQMKEFTFERNPRTQDVA